MREGGAARRGGGREGWRRGVGRRKGEGGLVARFLAYILFWSEQDQPTSRQDKTR
jgi:hypothetical protein